ncbi:MAG: aminotransferase class I/II-fold pyridoxal phosphate-dependent enzyme, partial [Nitrospiria bacterium]
NPLGPPPEVNAVLRAASALVSAYPDIECRALRRGLARLHGLSADSMLIGNGSTEFIFLLPRVFGPRTVLTFPPTYRDYAEAAEAAGAAIANGYTAGARGDLAFVCNPNNPTGTAFDADAVRALAAARLSTLFVVDEAYVDLSDAPETFSLLSAPLPDNVIVLRSFTKTYAIPGLRLGYAVGAPALMARIERFKEPWAVNALALAVGQTLLDCGGHARAGAELIGRERVRLIERLGTLTGFHPAASRANFVLVRLPDGLHADALRDRLIEDRILIRSCADFDGLGPSYIRVAVRTEAENRRLVEALAAAVKCLPEPSGQSPFRDGQMQGGAGLCARSVLGRT